jgi:uncharacterized membrane protein HdeD (DUF308 family)
VNLILLLLGPGNVRQRRRFLLCQGILLVVLGLLILLDWSDQLTDLTLLAIGYLLLVLGLLKCAFAVLTAGSASAPVFWLQGASFLIFGWGVVLFPYESNLLAPWLLGLTLVLNGLYGVVLALLTRHPSWRTVLTAGAVSVTIGCAILLEWREAADWVLPALLGLGILVSGLMALHVALRLGRYTALEGVMNPEHLMDYYLDFHVPERFRGWVPATGYKPTAAIAASDRELRVHVWTPSTVAKAKQTGFNVMRYVVARDAAGRITVGHAAVEMPPDLYISHCDCGPFDFSGTAEVWQTLRSRDVPGVFLPSFEEELKTYVQPSVTFRFRSFDPVQLSTFWENYRKDNTYNFTNRNCSVTAVAAIEAGLLGSLANRAGFSGWLDLLLSGDLWLAQFLRNKAREAVWTPGMVLDYTRALHRLVEDR